MNVVCRLLVQLSLQIVRNSDHGFAQRLCQPLQSSCCCSCAKKFYLCSFFFDLFLTVTIRLSTFQVLALTPQPVKLSSSRFTTQMDITLSNWLSTKIWHMQSLVVPVMDPLLVPLMANTTSTYRATFRATQDRIPIAVEHTLFHRAIQLVSAHSSLEAIISLLQTLKYSTK